MGAPTVAVATTSTTNNSISTPSPAAAAEAAATTTGTRPLPPVQALKLQRRAQGKPTTTIIPANLSNNYSINNDGNDNSMILSLQEQLRQLMKVFEQKFYPDLQQEYAQALEDDLLVDENGWYRGYRRITGGRYEIKVLGDYFQSLEGFESLAKKLVKYAEQQALQHEFVQAMAYNNINNNNNNNNKGEEEQSSAVSTKQQIETHPHQEDNDIPAFADWSIIVSKHCEAQTIHVDVPTNNVQFGMILNTDPIPGTNVVIQEDFGPHTVEELLQGIWCDAPDSLRTILSHPTTSTNTMANGIDTRKHKAIHVWVNQVLNYMGPLLHRRGELESRMQPAEYLKPMIVVQDLVDKIDHGDLDLVSSCHSTLPTKKTQSLPALQCGDMICTTGGVPHAGPACDSFRMVMFGAVAPTRRELYDVDEQYFSHSAMLFIIQAVWDHIDMPSKSWLLSKLAIMALEYDPSIADKHDHTSILLTDFMDCIIQQVNLQESKESYSFLDPDDERITGIVQDFLDHYGHKTQSDLFEYCPPGMQATLI